MIESVLQITRNLYVKIATLRKCCLFLNLTTPDKERVKKTSLKNFNVSNETHMWVYFYLLVHLKLTTALLMYFG